MLAFLSPLVLFAAPTLAATSTPCRGADPAILGAAVVSSSTNGNLKHYVIRVTVANLGNTKQASNLLQSVDVYQNDQKADRRGLPPLAPRQRASVTYAFDRSADADEGTTHLIFALSFHGTAVPGNADCRLDNDRYTLTV